jgi:PEP-CTERM motif
MSQVAIINGQTAFESSSLEAPPMRLGSGLLAFVVCAAIASHKAEASAILLTDDRGQFDAALGGKYQTFTDFPLTHVPYTYDFTGNFGGLQIRQEGLELNWGESLGVNGLHSDGHSGTMGLWTTITQPVTAIGFDVLSSWSRTPAEPYSWNDPAPNDLLFSFATVSGREGTWRASAGEFAGVILYNDAFAWVSLMTAPMNCICLAGFTIDNLAVQSVPEPSSALLLFTGVSALLVARRRRRSAGLCDRA